MAVVDRLRQRRRRAPHDDPVAGNRFDRGHLEQGDAPHQQYLPGLEPTNRRLVRGEGERRAVAARLPECTKRRGPVEPHRVGIPRHVEGGADNRVDRLEVLADAG